MKRQLFRTSQFKRSYKKLKLKDEEELEYIDVIYRLIKDLQLDEKHKDHQLKGHLLEFRELHIRPDLLLIYKIEDDILKLVDIGSHSDLFD